VIVRTQRNSFKEKIHFPGNIFEEVEENETRTLWWQKHGCVMISKDVEKTGRKGKVLGSKGKG